MENGRAQMDLLPSSSVDGSIAAVAVRIRDRAMQLIAEQKLLQTTRQELQNTRDIICKQREVNNEQRHILLETTNARNAVEMKLFGVNQKIQDYQALVESFYQDMERMEDECKNLQMQWDEDVQTIFSLRELQMECYIEYLKDGIERKETRSEQRCELLKSLEAKTETLIFAETSARQECGAFQLQTNVLMESKKNRDCKVTHLSKEIREALKTRTSIRQARRRDESQS